MKLIFYIYKMNVHDSYTLIRYVASLKSQQSFEIFKPWIAKAAFHCLGQ